MIEIDGSTGVGGGQIVRTALALSVATQQPIRLSNIRAGRSKPGLRPQHLTAVKAAAAIGEAETSSVTEGTRELTFVPSTISPGRYSFDVGTAGSAVLVLQTVLPPLLTAREPSRITVEGGTHVRSAPPFAFFDRAFLPLVQRMGPVCRATLDAHGFYPRGGGRCTVDVEPCATLAPLEVTSRGRPLRRCIEAVVANLPAYIAEREINVVRDQLPGAIDEVRIPRPDSLSAGNALILELVFESVTEVVSAMGEKGKPAEDVAEELVAEARHYIAADAPIGPYLADQLLLPLALGGGTLRTMKLTGHTHTNAAVIESIVGDVFSLHETDGGWVIEASRLRSSANGSYVRR